MAVLRHAIVSVLEARQVEASNDVLAAIAACADAEVLERWLRRASVAPRGAEVVEPGCTERRRTASA